MECNLSKNRLLGEDLEDVEADFSDATFVTLHQASTPWRGSRAIVRVKPRRFRGADILGLTIVARSRVLFESPAFVCTSGWAATAGTTSREKLEGPHPVSPGPSDLRLLPRIACGLIPASGSAGPGGRQPRRPARPFEQRVARRRGGPAASCGEASARRGRASGATSTSTTAARGTMRTALEATRAPASRARRTRSGSGCGASCGASCSNTRSSRSDLDRAIELDRDESGATLRWRLGTGW